VKAQEPCGRDLRVGYAGQVAMRSNSSIVRLASDRYRTLPRLGL
jgi:hypothetical protein